jgi:putative YhbY family RNA-binding protein
MPASITPRERARLKALAHSLEPVVHIGHGGITSAVIAEIERALDAHGLIKVRAGSADREGRAALRDAICARTDATHVQSVGKVMALWRPQPESPEGQEQP